MIKRFLGAAVAAVVGIAATITCVYAEDKFPREYSIENILTLYQVFVKGDLDIESHTVGAIAAGGNGIIKSSWGDAQISPTYINHIVTIAGNFNGSEWVNGDLVDFKNTSLYYSTAEDDAGDYDVSSFEKFKKNEGYIDFDKAFAKIQAESDSMALNSYLVSLEDCVMAENEYSYSQLDIDLSLHDHYTIPYEVYQKIDIINFIGVEDSLDLAKHKASVSVTGVNDNDLDITFGYSSPGGKKGIRINGEVLSNGNSFKRVLESEQGGQMNLAGLTLIWNFPDAQGNIEVEYLGGHVVAPNAHLSLVGGNYEGGVIANSLYTNSEGHFFSYMRLKSLVEESSSISESSSEESSDTSSEIESSSEESSDTSSETESSSEESSDTSSETESSSEESSDTSSVAESSSRVYITKDDTPHTGGAKSKMGIAIVVLSSLAAAVFTIRSRRKE